MSDKSVFNKLVGKRVDSVYLADDDWRIMFITSSFEAFCYETQGDCCNSVWFSGFLNLDNLLGAVILEIEEKEWAERNDHPDNTDCLDICFITFKTTKGYFDLEVRNSSNGYYGGVIAETRPFNPLIKTDLREITSDY